MNNLKRKGSFFFGRILGLLFLSSCSVVFYDIPGRNNIPSSSSNNTYITSNTGEVRWITHLGTNTKDNINSLNPNSQIDTVDNTDVCSSVAKDSIGNVYCGGYTKSSLNDVANVSNDAFVMKLNSNGVIQWITHLGTGTRDNTNGLDPYEHIDAVDGSEICRSIAVDSSGNIYCGGDTSSSLNDTGGGGSDVFVMKLNSNGIVQWVTHLGTGTRDNTNGLDPYGQVDAVDSNDYCQSVALDSNENVYCAGYTQSALNDSAGGRADAFVMKLNTSGAVQWVTHLGTGTRDNTNGLDPYGQVDAVNGAQRHSY